MQIKISGGAILLYGFTHDTWFSS